MKWTAPLVALLTASLALAGCADEAPDDDAQTDDNVDTDTFQLAAGKGAIAGLLVDDRFRPIELTDAPESEFQASGFVLLQETGQQVQTNLNGEFTFVDLDPGSYTIRVQAEGHEAIPTKVSVEEGVFNELSVVARRVLSAGGFILTQEATIFSGCPVEAVAISFANPWCLGDFSNDAGRFDFETNLTEIKDDVTAVVTEAKFNKPGNYNVVIRNIEGCAETWCEYGELESEGADYLKFVHYPGQFWLFPDGSPAPYAYSLNRTVQTAVFPHAEYTYEPLRDACAPVVDALGDDSPTSGCRGLGAALAVKAKFLQSVFLGEPDVDVEVYCALC